MLKQLKFSLFLSLVMFGSMSGLQAFDAGLNQEKIYIDEDDFTTKGDAFHIHIGNNVWLVTNTVHRDATGLFTYECNLRRSMTGVEYEKKWKCPYCYQYWPIGTPCQNKDCPSKYK